MKGFLAELLRLAFAAALGAGFAGSGESFGRFVAKDAGMSSEPLAFEVFSLLLAGMLGGLLLRVRGDVDRRIGSFAALLVGAVVGLWRSSGDVFVTVTRFAMFAAMAAWAAFGATLRQR